MKILQPREAVRPLSLIGRSAIALSDQALLSAVNFLVTILLIKTVPKYEYGYYSIAFSISLFLVSVQNAIVNAPLTVLLVSKRGEERHRYPAGLGMGQLLVVLPLATISLLIVGLLYLLGLDSPIASIAGALSLASIGILLREFLRGYYFAEESPTKVLQLDIRYAMIYVGLIGITAVSITVTVPAVLLHMGLAGLVVSASFWIARRRYVTLDSIREGYRENWEFGKWALIGVCVTHVQSYGYLYLLGSMLGGGAVGDVSASRLLLMPFVLLEAGWGKVAMPHGSRLREERDLARFLRELIAATLAISIFIAVYAWLLVLVAEPLGRFIFTDQYGKATELVFFWGLIHIMHFIALNAGYGLQVMREFRVLAKINAITMLLTLSFAYFLIGHDGIRGALLSLMLGHASLAIPLWYLFVSRVLAENRRKLPKGPTVTSRSMNG